MQHSGRRTAITAVILVALWYILSGLFDLLHFGTGVVTALIVAATFRGWDDDVRFHALRLPGHIVWLIGQIVISNLRVARVVLNPRMPIEPTFIAQPPGVHGGRALTTLGSGITLTPGTLTVEVGQDELFVHALDSASAQDIRDNVMARRVARLFEPRGP